MATTKADSVAWYANKAIANVSSQRTHEDIKPINMSRQKSGIFMSERSSMDIINGVV